MVHEVAKPTLGRLPLYLDFLRGVADAPPATISAAGIAEAIERNPVQVRKDLAAISGTGKPKVGYQKAELIRQLERFLGCDETLRAVLVGAGRLGSALYEYGGFAGYGVEIVAAFDEAPREPRPGKPVYPMAWLESMCRKLDVSIGILTVPAEHAQAACDRLVQSGVRAVWNFAPMHLSVPPGILVQNENMASSLAVLRQHLIRSEIDFSKEE